MRAGKAFDLTGIILLAYEYTYRTVVSVCAKREVPMNDKNVENDQTVVLIAPNVSQLMGGEGIKAYQFLRYLVDLGVDVFCITHERSEPHLNGEFDANQISFVKDTWKYRLAWKSRVLRFLVSWFFHLDASHLIRKKFIRKESAVLHYLCPISPIALRFQPRGFKTVMGPLNGNIYHPGAFMERAGRAEAMEAKIHILFQRVYGALFGDKKKADTVLVSGFDRTRVSLRAAGVQERRMIDVIDSGIAASAAERPAIIHEGTNYRFVFSGRMIALKGIDMAIRALERTNEKVELHLYGTGPEEDTWKDFSKSLGLSDRVTFHGWTQNDELLRALLDYRGFVFPTLSEANGIVMQEAMMCGLPVIALNWGGPMGLAPDGEAILIAPDSEEAVIDGLARAMDRLAMDPEYANDLVVKARKRAENKFQWPDVARSWMQAY